MEKKESKLERTSKLAKKRRYSNHWSIGRKKIGRKKEKR